MGPNQYYTHNFKIQSTYPKDHLRRTTTSVKKPQNAFASDKLQWFYCHGERANHVSSLTSLSKQLILYMYLLSKPYCTHLPSDAIVFKFCSQKSDPIQSSMMLTPLPRKQNTRYYNKLMNIYQQLAKQLHNLYKHIIMNKTSYIFMYYNTFLLINDYYL